MFVQKDKNWVWALDVKISLCGLVTDTNRGKSGWGWRVWTGDGIGVTIYHHTGLNAGQHGSHQHHSTPLHRHSSIPVVAALSTILHKASWQNKQAKSLIRDSLDKY